MRAALLFREAGLSAWSTKVSSALILFLVALMCASTLATVGRTAAAEAQLVERLDAAGSRILSFADVQETGLMSPVMREQISGLSTVERAVGVGPAKDAFIGALGPDSLLTAVWEVHGDFSDLGELVTGRWPVDAREAVIVDSNAEHFGLAQHVGWAQTTGAFPTEYPIVGTIRIKAPFENYGGGIIAKADRADPIQVLHVVTASAEAVSPTQEFITAMINPAQPDLLRINSPASLAELRSQVLSDLGVFGHSLLVGVLGAGASLVAIITLADVLIRRKDLGRRRALGATRSFITLLVMLRALLPALAGVMVGTVAGSVLSLSLGVAPPVDFVLAVAILATLAVVLSSIAPSVYAATRDPVRVLRTP